MPSSGTSRSSSRNTRLPAEATRVLDRRGEGRGVEAEGEGRGPRRATLRRGERLGPRDRDGDAGLHGPRVPVRRSAGRHQVPAAGITGGLEFWIDNKVRELRAKAEGRKYVIGVLTGHREVASGEDNLVPSGMGTFSNQGIIVQNSPFYSFVDVDLHGGSAEIDGAVHGSSPSRTRSSKSPRPSSSSRTRSTGCLSRTTSSTAASPPTRDGEGATEVETEQRRRESKREVRAVRRRYRASALRSQVSADGGKLAHPPREARAGPHVRRRHKRYRAVCSRFGSRAHRPGTRRWAHVCMVRVRFLRG
jgi:hypothetical protein